MILSGKAIHNAVKAGEITISPFSSSQLNPNSYNVRLGSEMLLQPAYMSIDPLYKQQLYSLRTNDDGHGAYFELNPGRLYLGHTEEIVGSDVYVPMLNGRSSLARLGLQVHLTAGLGDVGFLGKWTLEFTTVNPIRLYIGMEIAQFAFYTVARAGGEDTLQQYNGKYQGSQSVVGSRMYTELGGQ
ncbi:deoxycytidine triphosphate deaminase [Clostridia bacterium]|nr:deoxycytidine triphosphate deaminase [Clostridia bacterium]